MNSEQQVRVLLIEDDPDDVYLIQDYLKQDSLKTYHLEKVSTLNDALAIVTEQDVDVILLDLGLPDASQMQALDAMIKSGVNTPIVVLTINDDRLGEEAIRHGAADYLPKKLVNTWILSRSIRYSIERSRLILELHDRAERDVLTGLPNRAMIYDKLDFMIAQSERSQRPFSLVMMDFDKFKEINDSRGHRFGDQLLKAYGQRLAKMMRKSDYVSRYGGDEFLMIISNYDDDDELTRLLEEKQSELSKPYQIEIDGETFTQGLSISIGVMPWEPGTSASMMLEKADQAMYRSKRTQPGKVSMV